MPKPFGSKPIALPARDALVLEYLGDGNALDTNDGTKATLTATNVPYASCPVGYQKHWGVFNGASSKVTTPSSSSLNFSGTTGFTFIVSVNASGSSGLFIHREDGSGDPGGYWFGFEAGNIGIRIRNDSNSSVQALVSTTGRLGLNKQFTGWYDGSNLKLFDGITEVANVATSLSVGVTSSGLGIGSTFGGGGYLSGNMGSIRMFNRPLTETERLAYFHEFNRQLAGGSDLGILKNPSSIFSLNPGNSFDAVLGTKATEFNSPTQATDNLGLQKGVTLNGSSQYMTFPSSSSVVGSVPRTIICKFKLNTGTGTRHLVSWGNITPNRKICSLSLNEPNSRGVQFGFLGNDYYTAGNAFTLNDVHTVIATYDGGTLSTSTVRIYLDGVKQSLSPSVSSPGAADTYASEVYVGRWLNGGNFFSGDIYFSEILDGSVSDSEALALSQIMQGDCP